MLHRSLIRLVAALALAALITVVALVAHPLGGSGRAQSALAISSAAPLLGLLAWAYTQLGDGDMSQHLLGEALDRHAGPRLSVGLPLLQKWLDTAAARRALGSSSAQLIRL